MKLSTPRYTLCLIFQLSLMFCDLLFNCLSLFPRYHDGLLLLYIFQDLFLVLSITIMLMTFFSTYLFQWGGGGGAGAWRRAGGAGLCGAAYALSCGALQAANTGTGTGTETAIRGTLYTVQRCLSACYYFVCKRAALRAGDPRLHDQPEWRAALRPR